MGRVARHGWQADERSEHFELLIEAEEAARVAKKGVHTGMAPEGKAGGPTDLTTPDARDRAKRFLSALQRQGKVRAVVQFVPNGSRFKLLVPKENCVINFACVGLRCPQCSRGGDASTAEPYGDEALAFARSHAFQRDVDIEVETADKNGTFMGALFLPDKRNYAVPLLEAGLAKLMQPMADRSTYGVDLTAAERVAKAANAKLWENWSAAEEAEAAKERAAAALADAEPTADADKQMVELAVTEIKSGAHFYAQVALSKCPHLDEFPLCN